jgi:hypothetical protein
VCVCVFSEFRVDISRPPQKKKNSPSREPKPGSSLKLTSSRADRRERRASHVELGDRVAVVVGEQAHGLATGASAGVGRGFLFLLLALFLFESREVLAFV